MRGLWIAVLAAMVVLGLVSVAWADEPLVFAVKHTPPFVIAPSSEAKPEGFSIELAEEIGRRLDPPRAVRFVLQPDLERQLDAVASGQVDAGISATTITAERQRRLDFSQPFFRSGLGILVPAATPGLGLVSRVLTPQLAWVILGTILYILLCAHLIWIAERGSPAFNDRWLPGVAQGVWWVVVTMSTVGYGDVVPKKPVSKFLAAVIIFTGIVMFGVAVASFSSALTVENLRGEISRPEDLGGRRIAVIGGTTSAVAVQQHDAKVVAVQSVEAAAEAVLQGKADAAVHDVPLLQHYVKTHPDAGLVVADAVFEPANYGVTFPIGSPLRQNVNVVLLQLLSEDAGFYAMLRAKWFGTAADPQALL